MTKIHTPGEWPRLFYFFGGPWHAQLVAVPPHAGEIDVPYRHNQRTDDPPHVARYRLRFHNGPKKAGWWEFVLEGAERHATYSLSDDRIASPWSPIYTGLFQETDAAPEV